MPDYSKSIIYTIYVGDSLYVGSTCNFTKRKWDHKNNIYNEKSVKYNYKLYQKIRENDGELIIKPYSQFPCDSKLQLSVEEERVRRELNGDLNMRSCGTGLSVIDYKKKHYQQNAEKVKKRRKEYYLQNTDKILELQKEKIQCECGCFVNTSGIAKHRKSQKHNKLMND